MGSVVADLTISFLEDRICSANGAISTVFGTTFTNIGLWNGGCVEIRCRLNKPLHQCACRKHIGELIAEKVFDALTIEKSQSLQSKN